MNQPNERGTTQKRRKNKQIEETERTFRNKKEIWRGNQPNTTTDTGDGKKIGFWPTGPRPGFAVSIQAYLLLDRSNLPASARPRTYLPASWLTYLPTNLPTYQPTYLPTYLFYHPTYLPTNLPTSLVIVWLFVVLLFVVCCLLFAVASCSFVVCCLLLVARYLFCCLLCVCCLLIVVCCLFAVCCLLFCFVVCCLI